MLLVQIAIAILSFSDLVYLRFFVPKELGLKLEVNFFTHDANLSACVDIY